MKRGLAGGYTLIEVIITTGIISVIGAIALSFFVAGEQFYWTGTAQTEMQSGSRLGQTELTHDLQESTLSGITLNSGHNAILLASARSANGTFSFSSAQPYWRKWICYYLSPEPGSSFYRLIRQEGTPSGLPSLDETAPLPAISSSLDWVSMFQSYSESIKIVSEDLATFDVEYPGCGTSPANPVYVQVIASGNYGGKLATYNPGDPAEPCTGKSGNWIQVSVKN